MRHSLQTASSRSHLSSIIARADCPDALLSALPFASADSLAQTPKSPVVRDRRSQSVSLEGLIAASSLPRSPRVHAHTLGIPS